MERVGITEKQALILLAEMQLKSDSALDAAMKAVEQDRRTSRSLRRQSRRSTLDSTRRWLKKKVTRQSTPINASEYQVAHVEDRFSGEMFKFIVHERMRFSRS